jgi:cytochrome bd ubiquinol oxidase subunit II
LHIPLTLILIGIVLRGSAFTFRSYDRREDNVQRRWGRIFAIASLVTPVLLGVVAGALASGAIQISDGVVTAGFWRAWLAPFPFAVGLFALALFAFLAAVYLTLETTDPELREDFRQRGLAAAVIVGLLALLVFGLSGADAPVIRRNLATSWWTWPLQIATGCAAVGAIVCLWQRRYRLARSCAAVQVSLILWGWGAAQFPSLVAPDLTLYNAAAPPATLRLLGWALIAGALLLLPSFYYLFRVFKSSSAFAASADQTASTQPPVAKQKHT